MTEIKHKHHIIPKHMGGTDDLTNLVELTVEEHIQAHRELYEKYGHKEDAWAVNVLRGGKYDMSGENNPMYGRKLTPEHIAKRTATRKANGHYRDPIQASLNKSKSQKGNPKSNTMKSKLAEWRTGTKLISDGENRRFLKTD